MKIDLSKIKLVIWDLDETFWKGVLSDNTVEFDEANAELVRDMTDAGVINSICSKNDFAEVEKIMTEREIWDLFVFKSINWSAKGDRIKQIISEMNLRAPNVLFIDDNETNLGEAAASCDGLMTSNVDVISELQEYFRNAAKKDLEHKRLKQYKVLEEKQNFKATVGSNEEFLRKCNIKVEIKYDCAEHIERIHDLVLRSNQLNFTKVRSTEEELKELIADADASCCYVEVKDNFGDYGIVGFWAVKDGKLIHFVFSCRTLNMGVEQYVYHVIGKPELTAVGEVSSSLDCDCPDWINTNNESSVEEKTQIGGGKIIIKGPCDMQQMFSFIKDSKNIITEFVYVNNKGVSIEQANHTTHIVESLSVDKATKKRLAEELPFGDKGMFETKIFDEDVKHVMLSTFTDSNLGLYREKNTGILVAFGEYTNDLTDKSKWNGFINKEVFVANCKFSEEDLQHISDNWEFAGRIPTDITVENLDFIFSHMSKSAKLILCIGSELEYEGNCQEAYSDRHIRHKELNAKIRSWAENKDRVFIIDVNDFITGQDKYTNNINHFTKEVYYEMSKALVEIVNGSGDNTISFASDMDIRISNIKGKIKRIPNKIVRMLNKVK